MPTLLADLALTISDGKISVVPGTSTVYTITASNLGPDDAIGASVSVPLPTGADGAFSFWTSAGAGGGTGTPPAAAP